MQNVKLYRHLVCNGEDDEDANNFVVLMQILLSFLKINDQQIGE